MRESRLNWWEEYLGFHTLADLPGALPRVEKALRILSQNRAGKTVANYAEALGAMCDWCVARGYLTDDPLRAMAPFDTTPQATRRALTTEEFAALLAVSEHHQTLLYETAYLSGLRAKELRSLTLDHLSLDPCGLHLDAAWTKNRKNGFQPIPEDLALRLRDFALSGKPAAMYDHYKRDAPAADPLLYLPYNTSRQFDDALVAAGIEKRTGAGKLDFHGFRLAFINRVIESGATVKEAQQLARHSTPELTMNTYGRVQANRLAETVEGIAAELRPVQKCAIYVPRVAVGAETESATPFENRELHRVQVGRGAGIRTRDPLLPNHIGLGSVRQRKCLFLKDKSIISGIPHIKISWGLD